MSDNKKYYYMKLKENFFDSDELIILESMPDGVIYSNILLKLYLKSLKYEGLLMFKDTIPYNANMIATVTRHQVGTVEKAISIFKQLNLIEVLDNGALYMSDIELFIGKSSTEGDRKKAARLKINTQLLEESGHLSDICPQSVHQRLEIRDKSIENKDNIKDLKDITDVSNKTSKVNKLKYYDSVFMTEEEYFKLLEKFGNTDTWNWIHKLGDWKESKGRKTKSDYKTILSWHRREIDGKSGKSSPTDIRNKDWGF